MRSENRRPIGPDANFEIPRDFTPPITMKGRIFTYRKVGDTIEATTDAESDYMSNPEFIIPVNSASARNIWSYVIEGRTVVKSNTRGLNKAQELLEAQGFRQE